MRPRARPPVPMTPMRMRSFAPRADAGAGRQPARSAVVAPREAPRKRRLPEGLRVSVMVCSFRPPGPSGGPGQILRPSADDLEVLGGDAGGAVGRGVVPRPEVRELL